MQIKATNIFPSSKRINFGVFANEETRELASRYLTKDEMYEAETMRCLTFSTDGQDIFVRKNEEYIDENRFRSKFDLIPDCAFKDLLHDYKLQYLVQRVSAIEYPPDSKRDDRYIPW